MISATTPIFAEDGCAVTLDPNIEFVSSVKHRMLVDHFGDKERFWTAVTDNVFNQIKEQQKCISSCFQTCPREKVWR
jgi:hypothetical protein